MVINLIIKYIHAKLSQSLLPITYLSTICPNRDTNVILSSIQSYIYLVGQSIGFHPFQYLYNTADHPEIH